ncbi:MAG: dNTP triphosphohydrolase [Croceitalea sp.]|nr:dNTP triphosphohydrolase [Croceitalea sp.]
MKWEQLLSLNRFGDTETRPRKNQDETRLGFEVDYDRIIFSSAFRSLQDKTQVMPMPVHKSASQVFVHTRLTHSLEVSVVGRSLGRIVGKKLLEKHSYLQETLGYQFNDFGAIVAAASLAHDIGNPPFGHSGEKAIGAFFESGPGQHYKSQLTPEEYQDLIDFEGNANGFKLLTESRNGVPGGLRLSYATLGAFMKYPKGSLPKKPTKHISDKKFGYFQTEKPFFKEVVGNLGLKAKEGANAERCHRHPLTYLVEAADDICYTIIDFEDGINLGLIPEEFALEYLIKLVKDTINTPKYHAMTSMSDRLSYLRALAINTLLNDAVKVFVQNEDAILDGSFDKSLLEKSAYRAQIDDIINLSVSRIYQSKEVVDKELAGYKIIEDILHVYTKALINSQIDKTNNYDRLLISTLPKQFHDTQKSTYELLLAACCFVSGLSDGAAVEIHNKIMGRQL